jgi:hypothetical protein
MRTDKAGESKGSTKDHATEYDTARRDSRPAKYERRLASFGSAVTVDLPFGVGGLLD